MSSPPLKPLRQSEGLGTNSVPSTEVNLSGESVAHLRNPPGQAVDCLPRNSLNYLPLEQIGALDQAAPLAGWELPDRNPARLLEARMGKAGTGIRPSSRLKDALRLGANRVSAVP